MLAKPIAQYVTLVGQWLSQCNHWVNYYSIGKWYKPNFAKRRGHGFESG